MECWHFAEATSSGQPILRENEKDILIDQMVGLYHNKSKILNRQRGRIFLTTQRIIYVDDLKPTKNSLSLELIGIESLQFSSRFLRRSARLILFVKEVDDSHILGPDGMPKANQDCTSTWICPICMVTNETKGEFMEDTHPRPVCANCGVSADYEMTKDSITISRSHYYQDGNDKGAGLATNINQCPSCTFINHFQITNCEICGTRLPNSKIRQSSNGKLGFKDSRVHFELERTASSTKHPDDDDLTDFVQISFRKSDGVLFTQATEKTLKDLKKNELNVLYNKNLVSVNGVKIKDESFAELPLLETKLRKIGITSLEESGENQLLNNDIIFNNALTDLNSLMSLGSDIEKLYAGRSTKMIGDRKDAHKPMLILDREKFCNRSLFLDEIAREIYEFAISEFKAEKEKLGCVMITLVDLYAMYNKCMRIGTGLISPQEMREACERFEQLGLTDLRLTKVNGRVLCLASKNSFVFVKTKVLDIVHANTGCDLLLLMQLLNEVSSNTWTIGIIMEVLQNCIDECDLVIDEQISGIHYYMNEYWSMGPKK